MDLNVRGSDSNGTLKPVSRVNETLYFLWPQFVRLVATAGRDYRHLHVRHQCFSDGGGALPSRGIVIQHDQDLLEVLLEQVGLVS